MYFRKEFMEVTFPQPDCVLVIVAHPDDPEFGMGGTIARWTRSGAKVTYLITTDGSRGSSDANMTRENLAEIRQAEQRAAARVLGVSEVVFLGYPDGATKNTPELQRDLVRHIRSVHPDIVMTHDPTARIFDNSWLNHPDHRAVGDAALDAIYPFARDRLSFPELECEGLSPHKVLDIYLTPTNESNEIVDISDTIDQKIKALQEHRSQIGDPDALAERIREWGRRRAEGTPFTYAERFRRINLRG
ncbi:MAG: PIG-L deacetylase family protein [Chloroflexota bacterium]